MASKPEYGQVPFAPIEAGRLQGLSRSELSVYLVLAAHCDRTFKCWPGVPTIARMSGFTERQVQRAAKGLEAVRLVKVYRGGGREQPNTYELLRNGDINDVGVSETGKGDICEQKPRHFDAETVTSGAGKGDISGHKPRHLDVTRTTGTTGTTGTTPADADPLLIPDAGQDKPSKGRKARKAIGSSAAAESIYAEYPRKVKRPDALSAIGKAIERVAKRPAIADAPAWLLAKVQAYAAAVSTWPEGERQYVPYPASWFNQERYDDDPAEWKRGHPSGHANRSPALGEYNPSKFDGVGIEC